MGFEPMNPKDEKFLLFYLLYKFPQSALMCSTQKTRPMRDFEQNSIAYKENLS